MEIPSLITIQGAYDYFMVLLLLIALFFAAYIAAAYLGFLPGPSELVPELVASPLATSAVAASFAPTAVTAG
ncbi:hypothetical protein ACFPYI_06290 [Halomarina salina]|uniref:Cox cluster protein n=1 Tax=Halomarina salina TaxID=1872699 RepID=A0ABD5RK77_9EURY|nr:hypothetical protein [Halomarina salina]